MVREAESIETVDVADEPVASDDVFESPVEIFNLREQHGKAEPGAEYTFADGTEMSKEWKNASARSSRSSPRPGPPGTSRRPWRT